MFYVHNNNNIIHQCKMCLNKALTFGVGSTKLKFRPIVFKQYLHAKMFSIQMLLNIYYNYTFQSNCMEGLHFSAFHYYSYCFGGSAIVYILYNYNNNYNHYGKC